MSEENEPAKPDEEEPVRLRSGGMGWYEAEPAPAALLEKQFVELNELNRVRNTNLSDESLDARYGLKLAALETLLDQLELDEEIRDGAREQLQHARDVWASDPIQRQRHLGGGE